jgi:hypothetical protein
MDHCREAKTIGHEFPYMSWYTGKCQLNNVNRDKCPTTVLMHAWQPKPKGTAALNDGSLANLPKPSSPVYRCLSIVIRKQNPVTTPFLFLLSISFIITKCFCSVCLFTEQNTTFLMIFLLTYLCISYEIPATKARKEGFLPATPPSEVVAP